jgi:hypothetical protein
MVSLFVFRIKFKLKRKEKMDPSTMSDNELFINLKKIGLNPGPIMPTTRKIYEKKLKNFYAKENELVNTTNKVEDTLLPEILDFAPSLQPMATSTLLKKSSAKAAARMSSQLEEVDNVVSSSTKENEAPPTSMSRRATKASSESHSSKEIKISTTQQRTGSSTREGTAQKSSSISIEKRKMISSERSNEIIQATATATSTATTKSSSMYETFKPIININNDNINKSNKNQTNNDYYEYEKEIPVRYREPVVKLDKIPQSYCTPSRMSQVHAATRTSVNYVSSSSSHISSSTYLPSETMSLKTNRNLPSGLAFGTSNGKDKFAERLSMYGLDRKKPADDLIKPTLNMYAEPTQTLTSLMNTYKTTEPEPLPQPIIRSRVTSIRPDSLLSSTSKFESSSQSTTTMKNRSIEPTVIIRNINKNTNAENQKGL